MLFKKVDLYRVIMGDTRLKKKLFKTSKYRKIDKIKYRPRIKLKKFIRNDVKRKLISAIIFRDDNKNVWLQDDCCA